MSNFLYFMPQEEIYAKAQNKKGWVNQLQGKG
jgi:hypothetical protein